MFALAFFIVRLALWGYVTLVMSHILLLICLSYVCETSVQISLLKMFSKDSPFIDYAFWIGLILSVEGLRKQINFQIADNIIGRFRRKRSFAVFLIGGCQFSVVLYLLPIIAGSFYLAGLDALLTSSVLTFKHGNHRDAEFIFSSIPDPNNYFGDTTLCGTLPIPQEDFEESINIVASIYGERSMKLAHLYSNFGEAVRVEAFRCKNIGLSKQKYILARIWLEKSITLYETSFDSTPEKLATPLSQLAYVNAKLGEKSVAMQILPKALAAASFCSSLYDQEHCYAFIGLTEYIINQESMSSSKYFERQDEIAALLKRTNAIDQQTLSFALLMPLIAGRLLRNLTASYSETLIRRYEREILCCTDWQNTLNALNKLITISLLFRKIEIANHNSERMLKLLHDFS